MFDFDSGALVPIAALAIPVVAIAGGITAGIVRGIMRQRAWEFVQRERIAAIERGIDPEKLGSMVIPDTFSDGASYTDPALEQRKLRQNLMIGGLVTLFVGIALAFFLYNVADGDDGKRVWTVGLIPSAVGLALLIATALIKPHSDAPHR